MILSSASPATLALAASSLVAVLAYGVAAWVDEARADRLRMALPIGWVAQAMALLLDISGLGGVVTGARFGFAPALSMTCWLVLAVYLVESRFLPLPGARRVLALLAAAACVLALVFPGESRPTAVSPWAPLHWVLGLASYGLFGVAVLHAAMWNRAERQLRDKKAAAMVNSGAGMPLLRLERLTFQFVAAGVAVLSLAILLGWWFTPHWRWDHKTLLSVLGWLVLTGLLTGRQVLGWRGRRATRWLYFGAALLLLAYAGSRFVLEVLLQRSAGG
ncbi:cytochrome c biogenesis protein CcsA [Pelomonas sp. SE-A7]|uniref:cytochrome C assembly family protein n=1 Tax=Pelomonas sp. SE-A7 TaxID=3054953 RepID=UPI00259CCECA|nr:cytochrome c biogenesis protein CcsA [Pelomonas sp. SE-A7]MDM4767657.1 cytochrome c biogenesis protein CcsA [Pelomonas sp. SE-A7]